MMNNYSFFVQNKQYLSIDFCICIRYSKERFVLGRGIFMFILIFNQLVKMLIILIVGIVCVRIGLVSKEGSKTISNLLLMLVNPILIIMVCVWLIGKIGKNK